MKTVFTTGEAAEICKVSQQTIIRCFDAGRLKGFRVPGSRFRRIPREALVAFMKENAIPVDALDNGKRRVLVVDDDPDVLASLERGLRLSGFEVSTAVDGAEALRSATETRPDAIVLDINMPVLDGVSVVVPTEAHRPVALSVN